MSIYQEIWDADQDENGLRAVKPGDPRPASGYVVVHEPEEAGSEHKVIVDVSIPDEKRETYFLCERLFNNYTLDPGIREDVTPEETQEERDFIDAIVPLKPMQVAKRFIAQEQGAEISDGSLGAMIRETWFRQGKAGSKHASGFEHVFVGEQKDKGELPDAQAVKMGGYHFWYKYYLDDNARGLTLGLPPDDRIIYQGTRYGSDEEALKGRLIPEVVTLSFQWRALDFTTGREQLMKKPIGGFWVGCSPEGLIALGLVRSRTKVDKIGVINETTYQIDLHRLSDNPHSIRTFFPRFLSTTFKEIGSDDENGGRDSHGDDHVDGGETDPEDNPSTVEPDGTDTSLRLLAARVNVAGEEAGRETVTLMNTTPRPIDLDGWAIKAPNGWIFTFGRTILADGEARTFRMSSMQPQFRNKGGTIQLLSPDGSVQDEGTYTKEQAADEGHTIVF